MWQLQRCGFVTPRCQAALFLQPRHQSSVDLGQIRSMMQTLRRAKGLHDGTLRLCVTEDMRVEVSHMTMPRSSLPVEGHVLASWQGTPTSTVQEVVQQLQSSHEVHAGSLAPASASPAISSPSAVPTLIDITRVNQERARDMMSFVERTYPQLRLRVRHTSGHDLQGTKLHTISVELTPRSMGEGIPLPDDQQKLLESFRGEAVGEGYNGCLRRALQDAFNTAHVPFACSGPPTDAPTSVLALYAGTLASDGLALLLRPNVGVEFVECIVVQQATKQPVTAQSVPLTGEGLRSVLTFAEAVVERYSHAGSADVRKRLQRSPMRLILPRTGVRIKLLLRRLLLYYYGIREEDVEFRTVLQAPSLYSAEVLARLDVDCLTYDTGGVSGMFVLSKTSGTGKKAALELATVKALQVLFPDVFEREIAYHTEVRAMMENNKAAASKDVPPHPQLGLETQLRWALRRERSLFDVESHHLKANSSHPLWGVQTHGNAVWMAQLYIFADTCEDADKSARAAAQTTDAATTVSRRLCCCAFDVKKSRSEQKVMAAALAQHFADPCRAAVEEARTRGLIDVSGAPTSCSGVESFQDATQKPLAAALTSDPFLMALTPKSLDRLQSLPETPTADSFLERLWLATKSQTSHLGSIHVIRDAGRALYVAQCTRSRAVSEVSRHLVCEGTASTEIGALASLLKAAQATVEVVSSGGAAPTLALSEHLPRSLPSDAPLKTCADAIARLYGLHCEVHVFQEGGMYVAELLGVFPADSALLLPHARFLSTPFVPERRFALARGRADSVVAAVVRASQQAFEVHVRTNQRPFPEEPILTLQASLLIPDSGMLVELTDAVLSEIHGASGQKDAAKDLVFQFEQAQLCSLTFKVMSPARSATLEVVIGKDLLACARELCHRIATETRKAFPTPTALGRLTAQTAEQLLRDLCLLLFSFTVEVDTLSIHQAWHCRINIRVTAELRCCIAQASGNRKKSTTEAASMAALQRHFSPELPSIPLFAVMQNTQSASTDTVTCTEPYLYRAELTETA